MADHTLTEQEMRELLAQAAVALRTLAKRCIVVKPSLDKPYPDAPDHTPWSKFVQKPATDAYSLGQLIQHRLRHTRPPAPDAADKASP